MRSAAGDVGMTRVRVEDLPPGLRRQVLAEAEAGPADGPTPTSRRARVSARGKGTPYRCGTCGEVFGRYGKAAEDHADGHGGARLEAILPGGPVPEPPRARPPIFVL